MNSSLVIRHTITCEQYALYMRTFFGDRFRRHHAVLFFYTLVSLVFGLIGRYFVPLTVCLVLFALHAFLLCALRAFLLSDYGSGRYAGASVRYLIENDSVQILFDRPDDKSRTVRLTASITPLESADSLFLMSGNPFSVIILPKFAFSPDSMKELRAFIEKKANTGIRHI